MCRRTMSRYAKRAGTPKSPKIGEDIEESLFLTLTTLADIIP